MDRSLEKEKIRKDFWLNDLNYKILNWSNSPNCIIFISSAGIDLSVRDFYEWNTVSQRKEIRKHFGKCIFIRDPISSFYVDGINRDIDRIDKLIDFIKLQTSGCKIVIAGYSAGAYLALILASCLKNVTRVLAFSAIVSLYEWSGEQGDESPEKNIHLSRHINDERYSKYFNIQERIKDIDCRTLYFYPSNSDLDLTQKKIINESCNKNIVIIGFYSNKHSLTVNHIDHVRLLCSKDKHIDRIKKKYNLSQNVRPISFTLFNLGIILYLKEQLLRIKRAIIRFIKRRSK